MVKIAIIGAGGFGREVKMLIDQINQHKHSYDIIGFYDDNDKLPKTINGVEFKGNIDKLINDFSDESIALALGLGTPKLKKELVERLDEKAFVFPTLIHPSAIIGDDDIYLGQGSVICAGVIITCNIKVEDFVTLNLNCTIGHDTHIKPYSSFMPTVNISGEVIIESSVYVGTGAKIINQLTIGENSIIGAGAVVSKSLPANCTAVGIPAKPIRFH